MGRRMRIPLPEAVVETAEQAAIKALNLARSRKRGASEALKVAGDRMIAARVEFDREPTIDARQRRQGTREAYAIARHRPHG